MTTETRTSLRCLTKEPRRWPSEKDKGSIVGKRRRANLRESQASLPDDRYTDVGQTPSATVYADASFYNQHVVSNPNVLDGKPCIKGTRIPVALVLRYLAADDDPIEDLEITRKDVSDCLQFAATVCDQPLRSNDD